MLAHAEGKQRLGESLGKRGHDIAREGARVVHQRRKQAEGNVPPESTHDGFDRLDLALGALEAEVAGLDGHQHQVGRAERVEGEEADRRRAVDDAPVEPVAPRGEQPAEATVAVMTRGERAVRGLERRKRHARRRELEVAADIPQELVHVGRAVEIGEHRLADRAVEGLVGHAETGGAVRLRVHVDKQRATTVAGKHGGKVDGGRGLATATLLVDDRNHSHRGGYRSKPRGFGTFESGRSRVPQPGAPIDARPAATASSAMPSTMSTRPSALGRTRRSTPAATFLS